MEKKITNEHIVYLDLLRIFAAIAVIMIHTASNIMYSSDLFSFNWHVSNIADSSARWCVPVFAMISGVLFLNPDKNIPIKKLYMNHILRMIMAFVFWSAVYALNPLSDQCFTWERLISGHYHLWFLFMIAGFYMTVPLLREITKSKCMTKYFLIISFVFNILANTFFHVVLPCFQSLGRNEIISALSKNYDNMHIDLLLGYSFYFVLGYYMSRRTFCKKTYLLICLSAAVACLVTILLTYAASVNKNTTWTGWYDYFSLNTMVESIGIFLLIKNVKIRCSHKQKTWIAAISRYTFGIYLVHVLILELFVQKNVLISSNALITIPVISAIVFLSSLVISVIINKIPVIRSYII